MKKAFTIYRAFEKYFIVTVIFGILHITYVYNGEEKMNLENKIEKTHRVSEKKAKHHKHVSFNHL